MEHAQRKWTSVNHAPFMASLKIRGTTRYVRRSRVCKLHVVIDNHNACHFNNPTLKT